MGISLLGRKIGMTRVFTDDGESVPVTAISVGPCVITQVKRGDGVDGYCSVQIGYDDLKPRNSSMPLIGHDGKAGTTPKRWHREFRVEANELDEFERGATLTLENLADQKFVDVVGTSKGKGFQGVMKRYNFKGLCQTHGTERKHRSGGSISSNASNAGTGKIKKGIKMPGHMGAARVTVRSLPIIRIDVEQNILLVKGPVPGPNQGLVEVRVARRLYKGKARKQAEAAG